MKLTDIKTYAVDGHYDVRVQLDYVHYERHVFPHGLPAQDIVYRLRELAARIERRISSNVPDNKV